MLMQNIKKLKHNTAESFLPISRSLGMSLGEAAFDQLDRPAESGFQSFKKSFTKGLFG